MRCPSCGGSVLGASTFCPDCGHQLRARRPAPREKGPLVLDKRYLLGTKLGEGTTWAVFEATDLETKEPIAIRVAHPEIVRDPARAAKLHADGERLQTFRHAHVVPILRHGETTKGLVYRVTEPVRSPRLDQVLRESVLDWRAAFGILHQLCDVLDAVHAHGLPDRRLAPHKLYVELRARTAGDPYRDAPTSTYSVRAELCGRAVIPTLDPARSLDDQRLGPVEYLSPEQLAGKPPTLQSHIYSLGMLAYALVTGQPPFAGMSLTAIVIAQHTRPQRPPSSHIPRIPPDVDAVILTCLATDPARRYTDTGALRAAMRAIG